MKIKVPAKALKYDLNEYELLFTCFMAFIVKEYGYKDTRYYMYADDIKHILGQVYKHPSRRMMVPAQSRGHEAFGKLTKLFNFGILTQTTYTVEFIRDTEYEHRNGSLKLSEVEINDIEVIKRYYYLIGRVTSEDLVDTNTIIDRRKNAWTDKAVKPFFREYFMI